MAFIAARYSGLLITLWSHALIHMIMQREQVHTISEALQGISHPQSVQVTSQTRPGVTVDASQQVLIETLPPILVLHLKRFLYDTKVGGVVKIGKPISFTPELDIDPGRCFTFIRLISTNVCCSRIDNPQTTNSATSQIQTYRRQVAALPSS